MTAPPQSRFSLAACLFLAVLTCAGAVGAKTVFDQSSPEAGRSAAINPPTAPGNAGKLDPEGKPAREISYEKGGGLSVSLLNPVGGRVLVAFPVRLEGPARFLIYLRDPGGQEIAYFLATSNQWLFCDRNAKDEAGGQVFERSEKFKPGGKGWQNVEIEIDFHRKRLSVAMTNEGTTLHLFTELVFSNPEVKEFSKISFARHESGSESPAFVGNIVVKSES